MDHQKLWYHIIYIYIGFDHVWSTDIHNHFANYRLMMQMCPSRATLCNPPKRQKPCSRSRKSCHRNPVSAVQWFMNNKQRPVVISEQRCNMVQYGAIWCNNKNGWVLGHLKDLTTNLDTFWDVLAHDYLVPSWFYLENHLEVLWSSVTKLKGILLNHRLLGAAYSGEQMAGLWGRLDPKSYPQI